MNFFNNRHDWDKLKSMLSFQLKQVWGGMLACIFYFILLILRGMLDVRFSILSQFIQLLNLLFIHCSSFFDGIDCSSFSDGIDCSSYTDILPFSWYLKLLYRYCRSTLRQNWRVSSSMPQWENPTLSWLIN